jgi:hypothetical protein
VVGLQYLEQRYYDPAVGRFISSDPIGVSDYLYAGNDPVNGVDPSGLILTPLDPLVLAYDVYEVDQSARAHDLGGTLLNGLIAIGDAALTDIPFVPPALGEARAGVALAGVLTRATGEVAGRFALEQLVRGVYNTASQPGLECGEQSVISGTTDPPSAARLAAEAESESISRSVGLGREGERAVAGDQNTRRIESASGTADFRLPDRLTSESIGEIKNVKRLGLTKQLRDYIAFSKRLGIPFDLTVRENTRIYTPLQRAIDSGDIRLLRTLPPR